MEPLAISRDSPYTDIAWAQALDLDFPLLSDWNGEATHGFGVAFEHLGRRDVSARSAFLVDAAGVIRGAWGYEPGDLPNLDELLSAAHVL